MTAPVEPADEDRFSNRLELVSAILLGIGAVLTAFSAYKSALTDGDALQGYTQSTKQLSDANQFYNQSLQTYVADQNIFTQFAVAVNQDQSELADYIQTALMSENLQASVKWWQENDKAISPFDEDSPYTIEDLTTAEETETQAEQSFKDGAKADDNGDQYELANVLFAISLFFAGIVNVFKRRPMQIGLIGISGITIVGGGIVLAAALGG